MAGSLDKLMNDFFRRGVLTRPTQIGVFSSATANRGVKVNRTITAAYRVYADDAGAVIWGSGSVPDIRVALSRYLITKDNTGGHIRLASTLGQIKAYDAKWNTEQVAGVYGYVELVRSSSTMTLGGYGKTAGVIGCVETSGTMTVNTYHVLAGVAAISKLAGTGLTQTGKTAGFYCSIYDTTNWSDSTARAKWGYGLYVPGNAVNCGMLLGDFSSTTAGSGIVLNSTYTTAARVYADDGGVALTAGAYRASIARMLVATAITTGDISIYGSQGQVKVAANVTTSARVGGVWGYVEVGGTATVTTNASGVYAMCDLPTGTTIGTGKFISGVNIGSNDLGGTHTGKAVAINVEAPIAGAWDGLLNVPAALVNAANGSGADKFLEIMIDGVAARITAKMVA